MAERGTWLLTRRWAPEIILTLSRGPLRFNRLLEIPGISDRVVTVRLRELKYLGLVTRQVKVISPIRVEYALTDAGRQYVAPLEALLEVAEKAS